MSYLNELSDEVQKVANACEHGPNTVESRITLIRGGYASALLGFAEGQDLEAKRSVSINSLRG